MYYDNNGNLQSAQFTMSPIGIETENGDQLRFGIHRTFDKPVEDFEHLTALRYLQEITEYYLRRSIETSSSRNVYAELDYSWGGYYSGSRKFFSSQLSFNC